MQLSTNRVNFTTTTVAQFNYMKFLSQFRSKDKKDVQNIVTILGLHTDDVAIFDISECEYEEPKQCSALESRVFKSLIPYVTKKLSFNLSRNSNWSLVEFDLYKNTKIICDFKTMALTMVLSESKCYVIKINNNYHYCKEQLRSK